MIDFVSNDFLGFARSQRLLKQVNHNYEQYCQKHPYALLGARGARNVVNTPSLLLDLEEKIADLHQCEAALLAPSGYVANFGLSTHLAHSADVIFFDEATHISVTHSLAYCSHRAVPFRHNDLAHCEVLLEEAQKQQKQKIFIFISSAYTFTGTVAPMQQFLSLANRYGAHLIVDEAHAMGVLGSNGMGLCYDLGYHNFYSVLVTYGKALGCVGAAILTSKKVKQKLLQEPPLSYSTAMAPFNLVAIDSAYMFWNQEGEARRKRLHALQAYFDDRYQSIFGTASKPVYMDPHLLDLVQQTLNQEHLAVGMMTHFATPFLRVNVHAYNEESEIDTLIGVFQKLKAQGALFHSKEHLQEA